MQHWRRISELLYTRASTDAEREHKASNIQSMATAFCRFMVDWKARDGMNYYMRFLHAHAADQIRLFRCADIFDLSGSGLEQHNYVLKKLLHHYSNKLDRAATLAKRRKQDREYSSDEVIPDHIYQIMTRLRCQRQCQTAAIHQSRTAIQASRHHEHNIAVIEHVVAMKHERDAASYQRKRGKQGASKDLASDEVSKVDSAQQPPCTPVLPPA